MIMHFCLLVYNFDGFFGINLPQIMHNLAFYSIILKKKNLIYYKESTIVYICASDDAAATFFRFNFLIAN